MSAKIGIIRIPALIVLTCAFLLQGCVAKNAAAKPALANAMRSSSQSSASSSQNEASTVSFLAAGDNIFHEAVYKDALTPSGGYDFTPIYQYVTPEIHKADFAFINQEGPLGGVSLGLEGYPLFNAPQEGGTAVVQAGFNLISQANNHALDFGFKAIDATCAFWKTQPDVAMAGMNASTDEYSNIPVIMKKNIKIALIAYTWSLNGIEYPQGKKWCVQTDFDDVLSKVQRARSLADVVLVSAHWGEEYQNQADEQQKIQAKKLAEAGADIIIGNHPHVIQNLEWISDTDGRKTICAYAMGNFLSSQTSFANVVGGLLELSITKSDGKVTLQNAHFLPIVTQYENGYKNFRVYLLSDYTDALAAKHKISDANDMSPFHIKEYVKSVISSEFYSG